MTDSEFCNASKRIDGKLHSWEFDGDDPRIKCCWCGEIRDALTGKPIKTSPPSAEPDPWELLRGLWEAARYDPDDVMFQDLLDEAALNAGAALEQHDAERKSDVK